MFLETTYQHLQGLDKDSRRKARTKDYKFVLKDNQAPRTKAKDNITVKQSNSALLPAVPDPVSTSGSVPLNVIDHSDDLVDVVYLVRLMS